MHKGRPLRVSYGVGVDSTAMLIGLNRLGIRPDLILFADTGGELPETYAYLPIIGRWLKAQGLPPVTIVKNASPRAGHKSLEGECLTLGTVPSISYRANHSCAMKWKIAPQDKFCNHFAPFREAWARRERVITAIGYDAGAGDGRRLCKAFDAQEEVAKKKSKRWFRKYDYWYPLVDWGWDRAMAESVIRSELLPVPVKSSCFFCGARTKPEIVKLAVTHPDLFRRAVAIEVNARPKLRKIKGLGTRFAWGEFFEQNRLRVLDPEGTR
jgi:hypothetical protein